MEIKLENESLELTINSFGAELKSITGKETGTQYLWDADEKYWKRSAPVLFPFVGSLKDKKFTVDGTDYPMGQHGFARDMEFELVSQTKDEQGKQSDYYLKLDTDKAITYGLICDGGLLDKDDNLLKVDADGYCQIDEHMFDKDALIIENRQASKVSLCTPDKKPYLTVSFDAPLFGLWSPAGMGAPFICIEPWYGRCDRAGFAGELKDREYGNSLAQGEKFEKSYTIAIEL